MASSGAWCLFARQTMRGAAGWYCSQREGKLLIQPQNCTLASLAQHSYHSMNADNSIWEEFGQSFFVCIYIYIYILRPFRHQKHSFRRISFESAMAGGRGHCVEPLWNEMHGEDHRGWMDKLHESWTMINTEFETTMNHEKQIRQITRNEQ